MTSLDLRGPVSRLGEEAVATAYGVGWRAVRLLPEPAARAVFDRVADRLHARDGRGVRTLRGNLARVTGGPDGADGADGADEELVRAAVRSYLRYWCESFRLPAWDLDDLVARTRTVGEHRFRQPLADGVGVVGALPHAGNWDWAGAWSCGTGVPVMTVAERLRPERLYDAFVAYRESLGMQILPLTGGEPTLPRLARWVRDGGFAPLLADRDLSRTAVEVDLCGHRARLPRGPAVLARMTGAPLLPITCHYEGREMVITFHEAVPVGPGPAGLAAATQGVADAFTAAIRAHPEDWHMMQRVFVDDGA